MPELNKIKEQFRDKDVEFIGVEDISVKEFSASAIIVEVKAIIKNRYL